MTKFTGTKATMRVGGKEIVFDAFYMTINDASEIEFPTLPASEKEVQEFTSPTSCSNYEDEETEIEDIAEYGDCYD